MSLKSSSARLLLIKLFNTSSHGDRGNLLPILDLKFFAKITKFLKYTFLDLLSGMLNDPNEP
jgi:hypothetical protein